VSQPKKVSTFVCRRCTWKERFCWKI